MKMHQSDVLSGYRILLAEDDVLQALDLAATLEEAGAEVIGPALSSAEALELIKSCPGPCSAAILDFELRDGTVDAVASELRSRHAPFLLLTAFDCLPKELQSCAAMSKPADSERLIGMLGCLVQGAHQGPDANCLVTPQVSSTGAGCIPTAMH